MHGIALIAPRNSKCAMGQHTDATFSVPRIQILRAHNRLYFVWPSFALFFLISRVLVYLRIHRLKRRLNRPKTINTQLSRNKLRLRQKTKCSRGQPFGQEKSCIHFWAEKAVYAAIKETSSADSKRRRTSCMRTVVAMAARVCLYIRVTLCVNENHLGAEHLDTCYRTYDTPNAQHCQRSEQTQTANCLMIFN